MRGDTLASLRPRFAAQYTLERELGRGGMGIVFLARELTLDRLVAIKVLPPALADDPEVRERFVREARTAAQLSHPNIVPIFRADEMDGVAFFAMGYIEGESASERLAARGPLPAADVVRIVREVAWALAYAHARGVVHRDIKPENILLERGSGRVMVTDFGIARDTRATGMTADGMVLGSVHYMAPERVGGGEADGRSDLYSLGIVAYQLLSGSLPFDAAQASAVLLMHATRPPRPLRDVLPGVPAPLAAVIDRCLAKDPAARYQTGEALAEAFEDALRESQSGAHGVAERVLDEETAKGVWLRAAEMQADASRRIRERTEQAEEFATGLHQAAPTNGYRIDDVEAAGIEAGIAEEFIQLALAELTDDEMVTPVTTSGGSWLEQLMLGDVEHSLRVARVLEAPPVAVLESLGRTLPAAPWGLPFRDTIGGHPLDGGILTFSCPEVGLLRQIETSLGGNPLRYHLSSLGVREVRMALQPVAGDARRCEIVVTVDIRSGIGRNARIGGVAALAIGGGVGAMGVTIAIVGGAAAFVVPLFGVLPLAGIAGATAAGTRWGLRRTLRATRKLLADMLAQVGANARSRQVFGLSGVTAGLPGDPR